MRTPIVRVLTALSLVVLAGCGSSSNNAPPSATPAPTVVAQTLSAAATNVPATPTQPAQRAGQSAKAVAFEELMALLPEPAGWTRGKPRGEQISMGLDMSRAHGDYQKGESSIDLEITDSSFNQLFLGPLTTYLAAGYSERTNEGYRKASPVGGHPAFETWNGDSRRAEVFVVVANRFVVQATGHNVDNAEPVRALAQAVDFSRLAALK
jgi:hypothetical protein